MSPPRQPILPRFSDSCGARNSHKTGGLWLSLEVKLRMESPAKPVRAHVRQYVPVLRWTAVLRRDPVRLPIRWSLVQIGRFLGPSEQVGLQKTQNRVSLYIEQ